MIKIETAKNCSQMWLISLSWARIWRMIISYSSKRSRYYKPSTTSLSNWPQLGFSTSREIRLRANRNPESAIWKSQDKSISTSCFLKIFFRMESELITLTTIEEASQAKAKVISSRSAQQGTCWSGIWTRTKKCIQISSMIILHSPKLSSGQAIRCTHSNLMSKRTSPPSGVLLINVLSATPLKLSTVCQRDCSIFLAWFSLTASMTLMRSCTWWRTKCLGTLRLTCNPFWQMSMD